MHVERHERGIHAVCAGAAGAGVTDVRFPAPAAAGAGAGAGAGARADHDQLKLNGIALERNAAQPYVPVGRRASAELGIPGQLDGRRSAPDLETGL